MSKPEKTNENDELLELVYHELRSRAKQSIRHLPPGQTLQATALVHEAWARLSNKEGERRWESKQHFLSVATLAIRSIVADRVRAKQRLKRGGGNRPVTLTDDIPLELPEVTDEIKLAIGEALDELRRIDKRVADTVAFRFFLGMTEPECAEALNVSERTVRRDWTYARAWLTDRLGDLGQPWQAD
ncbi:MAG: ECF-type sigma factor [Planctomycetota bacterium]